MLIKQIAFQKPGCSGYWYQIRQGLKNQVVSTNILGGDLYITYRLRLIKKVRLAAQRRFQTHMSKIIVSKYDAHLYPKYIGPFLTKKTKIIVGKSGNNQLSRDFLDNGGVFPNGTYELVIGICENGQVILGAI